MSNKKNNAKNPCFYRITSFSRIPVVPAYNYYNIRCSSALERVEVTPSTANYHLGTALFRYMIFQDGSSVALVTLDMFNIIVLGCICRAVCTD